MYFYCVCFIPVNHHPSAESPQGIGLMGQSLFSLTDRAASVQQYRVNKDALIDISRYLSKALQDHSRGLLTASSEQACNWINPLNAVAKNMYGLLSIPWCFRQLSGMNLDPSEVIEAFYSLSYQSEKVVNENWIRRVSDYHTEVNKCLCEEGESPLLRDISNLLAIVTERLFELVQTEECVTDGSLVRGY